MKILIYGAGIIGSIYAARLYRTGNDVTILARGNRFDEIKHHGISLENSITGVVSAQKIPVIKQLFPFNDYELIIVTVRLDQIESIIPNLKENLALPFVLFMLNNPDGAQSITKELQHKQILMGFPGVGGTMEGRVVKFIEIKQQNTTLGALSEFNSEIILNLKGVFENAGFKTEISLKIEDWLKTHAVFISCVTASIMSFNGKSEDLADSRINVKLMVQSIREGFNALLSLGRSIEPKNLKLIFMTMPTWFSIWYWRKQMRSELGKLAIAPHAIKAEAEMKLVALKTLTLVHGGKVSTPKLDKLLNDFTTEKKGASS